MNRTSKNWPIFAPSDIWLSRFVSLIRPPLPLLRERGTFEWGERKVNLERLFNLREGLTPADDTLPSRALHEPLPDGASQGRVVNLEPMLKEYYEARDWDRTTDYPSPEKLKELNL
jgi:aldehyde:ferredoxin oxidoreductase